MSKPRQQSSGFSNAPKRQPRRKKPAQSSADQSNKEDLAVSLLKQGKLQEAEATYRELIAAGTTNHIVYENLATIYGMQSKLEECIKYLRIALKIKPNHPDTHNNLGIALKEHGDLSAAIDSFRKALELKGKDPYTHYNLGIALKDQGDLDAAIANYKKALHLKPNFPDALNNLGIALKEQGELDAAIAYYNTALQLKPNFPDALNNLGIALKEKGDLDAAIDSYNKALQLKPNFPDALNNLGNALQAQGDLTAAVASFNAALQLKSNYTEAHYNLGTALKDQGDLDAAIANYKKALHLKPNFPDALNNLGNALQAQGDLTAAIANYNTALQLKPNFPEALNNLGTALQAQGDLDAAIANHKKALHLKPNFPDALNNLGNALQAQGDLTAAIANYNTALELKPNYPEALNNLGTALQAQGDLNAAINSYNKALQLKPNYQDAHNNLGTTFQEQGDLTAAITSYNSALELNPNDPDTHNNLGIALKEKGDLDAAIDSYNTALQLNPNFPDAHAGLSHCLLQTKNYIDGWDEYEWRHQRKEPSLPHANPKCQRWGSRDLQEYQQLLLVSEQGLGDTLQFMRYAIALRKQGASVLFCAQSKLHSLIKTSGIDPSPLSPTEANQVTDGEWIPLLSVPRHLGVSSQSPIITGPYIKTTDKLIDKWKGIFSAEQRPIIGINWQGNPSQELTNSKGRSLPLETFAPIAVLTNASLLSLQKGFGSEQLETCSFRDSFVSCQPQVDETWDFLETAAIIANCDLVITSDTSVAHLAGGMGKNTWVLLKKVPDWRWGLEGDTTFWYPSMRLFRQKERGNWNELMERVAEALREHFVDSSTPTESEPTPQPSVKPKLTQDILAPISLGELIDKITILQIKTEHLKGNALKNVQKERSALQQTLDALDLQVDPKLIQRLKAVNQNLWLIEDAIRDQERQKSFGETFIHLARSVYQQNDRRSIIKKEINTTYGSALVEEKAYKDY